MTASDQPTGTPSCPPCLSWPLRKTVIFKGDDVLLAFYFLAKITLFLFFSWPHRVGMWDLVSQPGIEPTFPAVEVQSLNHWMSREVPHCS